MTSQSYGVKFCPVTTKLCCQVLSRVLLDEVASIVA